MGSPSEKLFAVRAASDVEATAAVIRAVESPTVRVEVVCPLNDHALKALEVQDKRPKQIV